MQIDRLMHIIASSNHARDLLTSARPTARAGTSARLKVRRPPSLDLEALYNEPLLAVHGVPSITTILRLCMLAGSASLLSSPDLPALDDSGAPIVLSLPLWVVDLLKEHAETHALSISLYAQYCVEAGVRSMLDS